MAAVTTYEEATRRPRAGQSLAVGFVLLPRFTLIAFSGMIDMLRLAADEGDRSRPVRCSWSVLSPDMQPVTASCGIQVTPWELCGDPARFDYVVVVGGLLDREQAYHPRTLAFLRETAEAGVKLVGICTGSLALAEAQLLRGRRCCVSWYHFTDLTSRYDDLIPVADQLFVEDGPFITCAGGSSSLDLGAWMVDRHLGPGRSQKCLHILVTDKARPPTNAQPQPPTACVVSDMRVRRAMLMIEQNLSTPQQVDRIASAVGLSKRQLERIFRTSLGKSIQEYSRDLRLLYGLWLLSNSTKTITAVAAESGFSDISHFNRLFRAAFHVAPSAMRRSGADAVISATKLWQGLSDDGAARLPATSAFEAAAPTVRGEPVHFTPEVFLKHERRPYLSDHST